MSCVRNGLLVKHAYYLSEAIREFDKIVDRYKDTVPSDAAPDTLVGTGLSGALVVPRLAEKVGLHWMIVRKDNDGTHSLYQTEGTLGKRWLFVDDLISSGTTYRRVREAVAKSVRHWAAEDFHTEQVGAFLYADNYFKGPEHD